MKGKMQVLQENSTIPAFLGKLWKMVNDPSTDHLISWSQTGNTFIIQNQAQFWYELLPLYYKHNNMSSFVRQLNMYGFHKVSILDNPGISVSTDKDDSQVIQFYHPYFQKDEPEKLKNIKRKTTNAKPQEVQGVVRNDDLNKVLSDVKQLRGRQSNVDSQLSAMKQENAVLWRELAILRQKHIKQQQIVNKLIQFLVTLVQPPTTPRMGVGVKRRMPLMLHESPTKKPRSRKNNRPHIDAGPTIHELDTEDLSPEQLLEEAGAIEDVPLIDSPITPGPQLPQDTATSQPMTTSILSKQNDVTANQQQPQTTDSSFWDKPEFVTIGDSNDEVSDNEEELINTLEKNTGTVEKVFLNPNNRDTLIGNLVDSETFNVNPSGGKYIRNHRKQPTNSKQITITTTSQPTMQVATKNNSAVKINNGDDLDLHLDHTQKELDQLKDILNGCNTFDANTLLGLFCDNDQDYGIKNALQNKENSTGEGDLSLIKFLRRTEGVEPAISLYSRGSAIYSTGQVACMESTKQIQQCLILEITERADPLVSGNEVMPSSNLVDFNELFDDEMHNQDTNLTVEPSILTSSAVLPSQNSSLETPHVVIKNEPRFPSRK